jgi:predicted N-acetyltransferase YhbS
MDITIRPLGEHELPAADHIFRLAFGTFVGLPEPLEFGGDTDYVRSRWRADPGATFAAVRGADLLGSNFATRWGTFGFFGPLSVRPELWDQGVAKRLLTATMDRFVAWRLEHAGLFTFAQSAKHIGLYHHFGFYPRFLTAVMAKSVNAPAGIDPAVVFSAQATGTRAMSLAACRTITAAIFDGLDLESEIRAVQQHALGDTVLLADEGELRGFAVGHVGAGTEAGSGVCYAVRGHTPGAARRR